MPLYNFVAVIDGIVEADDEDGARDVIEAGVDGEWSIRIESAWVCEDVDDQP